ncbi:hypothetical protein RA307_12755 [Xanthobacteraceae bacterium Astr-EGSB]|uniref:hypothetical protein n=1 Tax=Astrobacterium formosum TaxID=3069710 RepID=UPI0027AF39D1|nr:hypothetical protein [Xanthobacteraceae bacterium Astr-EGSB]
MEAFLFVHCPGQTCPLRRGRLLRAFRSIVVAAAAGLLMLGCKTSSPLVAAGIDPADANAPVAAATHRSTIDAYVRQRPVEPRPWSEQNQGVAPRPRD